jgi:hypothetical protein
MGSSFAHNYASLWLGMIEQPTIRRWPLAYRGRYTAQQIRHVVDDALSKLAPVAHGDGARAMIAWKLGTSLEQILAQTPSAS